MGGELCKNRDKLSQTEYSAVGEEEKQRNWMGVVKSMPNNIKLAIATVDTAPNTSPLLLLGDICQNLERAHGLGYSAIEIHTRENAAIDYDKVLKKCDQLDMRIAAIVTGRLHNEKKVTLIDDDSSKVKIAMDGMKKYIDMAQLLKSDVIIGWVKGVLPDITKINIYEERLAQNVKSLALYALEKNVKIFIEALNRYEVNFLNTGKEIMDFLEYYDIPNTFIHLDTFHMNIEEVNIIETIRECSSKLGYIHFADSNRQYPGAGHLDFLGILRALIEINFSGYVSVECLPKPSGEEAAKLAIQNIRGMSQRWQKLLPKMCWYHLSWLGLLRKA